MIQMNVAGVSARPRRPDTHRLQDIDFEKNLGLGSYLGWHSSLWPFGISLREVPPCQLLWFHGPSCLASHWIGSCQMGSLRTSPACHRNSHCNKSMNLHDSHVQDEVAIWSPCQAHTVLWVLEMELWLEVVIWTPRNWKIKGRTTDTCLLENHSMLL